MRFMTNIFEADAFEIAQCYRSRWQIEAMFKFIKQNLSVKSFLGTTANAVKILIYTAMIALLMLRYYQATLKVEWGQSNLLTCLRLALLSYRDLTKFLNQGAEKALSQLNKADIASPHETIGKMSARPPNGLA
jgi:IS4 transposase